MKLINANRVEELSYDEPSYSDPYNVISEFMDKIRDLPNIEAIPLGWIYCYRKRCLAIEDDAIREMVEAWKGEQEK